MYFCLVWTLFCIFWQFWQFWKMFGWFFKMNHISIHHNKALLSLLVCVSVRPSVSLSDKVWDCGPGSLFVTIWTQPCLLLLLCCAMLHSFMIILTLRIIYHKRTLLLLTWHMLQKSDKSIKTSLFRVSFHFSIFSGASENIRETLKWFNINYFYTFFTNKVSFSSLKL